MTLVVIMRFCRRSTAFQEVRWCQAEQTIQPIKASQDYLPPGLTIDLSMVLAWIHANDISRAALTTGSAKLIASMNKINDRTDKSY
jgi:hypothetical protein